MVIRKTVCRDCSNAITPAPPLPNAQVTRLKPARTRKICGQFCQPVVNGRVKGFQLRKGKFITRVGIHFSRVS